MNGPVGSGHAAGGRGPVPFVHKRDGGSVPYDPERIRRAVRRAQEAVGEDDALFATEVEEVVGLALAVRYPPPDPDEGELEPPGEVRDRAPGIEEIQDLVEQALIEMGGARVAKAYILYRDRRSRRRQALEVHSIDPSRPRPLVRDTEGTQEWSRGRIVAALVEEADLPRETAETVAERVERRVLEGGWTRLSSGLLRELVDNELATMGHRGALRRQEPVAVPRHDLRAILARPAERRAGPRPYGARVAGVTDAVAAETLRRWSLEDVLDPATADLFRAGELFVTDLALPHLPLVRGLPAERLLCAEPSERAAWELLGALSTEAAAVSQGVVIEGAAELLATLRGRLGDWLRAVGAIGAAAARSVDLGVPGGRSAALLVRLLAELAELARDEAPAPRLFLAGSDLADAIDAGGSETEAAAGLLLRDRRLVSVWHAQDERWAAPGCRRGPRERAVVACRAAVAFNLPRLARRAGPWREEPLFEELVSRLTAALDAFERIGALQREMRGAGRGERGVYAVTPVGLVEALRILGDGTLRPEQGARLLGVLGDAARRLGAERGLDVSLTPFFGAEAGERLARTDARRAPPTQPRLFEELPAPEAERCERYTDGFALEARPRDFGRAEPAAGELAGARLAALLATVPCGALHPAAPSGSERSLSTNDVLAAWRAFESARRSADVPRARASRAAARREPAPLFRHPLANR